ncbi:S8 family serine peptidase [Candidatus Chloroploca asiatica]|uniref:Peptidase S8/S53 domain-containing protein n=1 Tax=Candidatus Chloroploca asiatica TaxID=1506545 RepID=A0A2H3L635_9CHLR|nr:S8 family serine peptidase [Candidatus Chloroploca asiatica]PDV97705.1 hypothetical protein A9Q02_04450 [Candidatus Chloroploca asiatica]
MRRFTTSLALFFAILLMVGMVSVAESRQPASQQPIYLQAGVFDPLVDREPRSLLLSAVHGGENPYYLVQFTGPVQASWLAQLERLGAQVLGYLPEHTHVVRLAPEDVAKVRAMYAVRWLGAYQPAYKLAPAMTAVMTGPQLADARSQVTIIAHPGESLPALRMFLRGQGAVIEDSAALATGAVVRATLPLASLAELAAHPAIAWIEPYLVPELTNAEGRRIMGVEAIWQSRGLYGAGQIVAISDSGLSVGQGTDVSQLSPDFQGSLVRAFAPSEMLPGAPQCAAKTSWTDLNGHGTHVAGSVLGNGSQSGAVPANNQYGTSQAGPAPKARMVFMAMNTDGSTGIQCVPVNGNYIALGYENGARISTNSWGSNAQGAYTQNSMVVDDYIWRNQNYLVLYSAGNAGRNGSQTIGSPGSAKNVLTVGASENNRPALGPSSDNPNQVADFSSRGPTADGRLKPDLVAPGTNILSVLGAQASGLEPVAPGVPYAFSSGTSMATPLTAGVATQVREWVTGERGVADPSAALLKGLLIHGTARMPGARVNFDSGWGRVDLKNILEANYAVFEDNRSGLTNGQEREFTVQVAGSTPAGTLFVQQPALVMGEQLDTYLTLRRAPAIQGRLRFNTDEVSLQTVPGYDQPPVTSPIPDSTGTDKTGLPSLNSPLAVPAITGQGALNLQITPVQDGPTTSAFAYNVVLGGDFEDPGWQVFSQLWLGQGAPLRTSRALGEPVINGDASIWLGGTPVNDAIFYPVSFPRTIDSANASGVQFLFAMANFDPGFDQFCFALLDPSGAVIGDLFGCSDGTGLDPLTIYQVQLAFTADQRAVLAGMSGYLALFTNGDGELPHLSAFVDDVLLQIDYPDMAMEAVPAAGPPGSTFMLGAINAVPYFPVRVCNTSCANPENVLGTVYADARGDVLAYLQTDAGIAPGPRTVVMSDVASRTAGTTLTIVGGVTPEVTITPSTGPAGTEFGLTGAGFTPNDGNITLAVNGQNLGTVGSNVSGELGVTLRTASNTPAGTYQVALTDSAGRTASAQFQVTAVSGDQPVMTVAPQTGAPGSGFVFQGRGFAPSQAIQFDLDGEAIGELAAGPDGTFEVALTTNPNIPPGTYTLRATQGQRQASAQFQITGSGGGGGGTEPPPSGNGLYVTLVWTDPPAQASAARTLVNNLDLVVIAPDQTQFLGNGQADQINNVEGVRIENPAAGTYRIIVRATALNAVFGSQPFALIATTGQSYSSNTADRTLGERPQLDNKVFVPLIKR